jgi:hypothetical protein
MKNRYYLDEFEIYVDEMIEPESDETLVYN